MKLLVVCSLSGLFACLSCSSDSPPANPGGSGGTSGAAAGSTPGGSSTAAGTMQGGASGSVGASGTATGGAGGGGTSSSGGTAGSAGAAGSAGTAAGGSGGAGVTAGCANHDYELCIDFESGIDKTKWMGGSENSIMTTDVAHGTHAYRLYPQSPPLLKPTSMGKLTNQIWGRFYIHFKPGAPGGHGNLIAAFDQENNWYEMGWQFDAMMGVWHSTNDERPLRSKPFIVDQWYCVELFFDGTKTEMPKWWIDGKEAEYYMAANEKLIPKAVTAFQRLEIGFTPYAGLGLQMPDGLGPKDDRVLSDTAIDDIAFDTERIGCITQ